MEIDNYIMEYQNAITDIKQIIASGRKDAYQAASKAVVHTYWRVGKRIVEQEGKERVEYGDKKIMNTCVHNLNWTYFRSLLCISDENRLLQSLKKGKVIAEMQGNAAEYQKDKYELYGGPQVGDLAKNFDFIFEKLKGSLPAIEKIENELWEVTGNE